MSKTQRPANFRSQRRKRSPSQRSIPSTLRHGKYPPSSLSSSLPSSSMPYTHTVRVALFTKCEPTSAPVTCLNLPLSAPPLRGIPVRRFSRRFSQAAGSYLPCSHVLITIFHNCRSTHPTFNFTLVSSTSTRGEFVVSFKSTFSHKVVGLVVRSPHPNLRLQLCTMRR